MQLAFDLRRAGVNVNYAPVLDLMLMKMNTVIGSRAFGDDPQRVIAFAGAFARGMQSQGIVPTFKHFPGHGSTEVDSHLDLPVVDLPEERLRARDLAPFAQLLPGAQAVMTAHIVVQSLDPHLPATLSPRLLTDVLRDEIGFTGVCFTDCMQMNAIADSVGSAEGAVQALIAGADCVLVSHSVDCALESLDRVVWAVEQGRLPRGRLEQAHARVRRLRAGLQAPLPLDAHPPHAGVGREIGRRAVTLLRGSAAVQRENAAVISFEGATVEGVQGLHSDHAILIDDASSRRALPLEPEVSEVDGALAFLRARQKRPVVLMRRAHVYPSQAQGVRRIIDEFPETILVSTREPFTRFYLIRLEKRCGRKATTSPAWRAWATCCSAALEHPVRFRFPAIRRRWPGDRDRSKTTCVRARRFRPARRRGAAVHGRDGPRGASRPPRLRARLRRNARRRFGSTRVRRYDVRSGLADETLRCDAGISGRSGVSNRLGRTANGLDTAVESDGARAHNAAHASGARLRHEFRRRLPRAARS